MVKNIVKFIFLVGVVFAVFPNVSSGIEETGRYIGVIVEIAAENIIQVGNRNYIVTEVYIDDGTREEPVRGFFYNLEIGDTVEVIYREQSHKGFLKAEKVIIYKGDKLIDVQEEIDKGPGIRKRVE